MARKKITSEVMERIILDKTGKTVKWVQKIFYSSNQNLHIFVPEHNNLIPDEEIHLLSDGAAFEIISNPLTKVERIKGLYSEYDKIKNKKANQ